MNPPSVIRRKNKKSRPNLLKIQAGFSILLQTQTQYTILCIFVKKIRRVYRSKYGIIRQKEISFIRED